MASTRWLFTLNNPTALLDFSSFGNVRYAIYSEEIGAEGTNHFQGYIQLHKQARLAALKDIIPGAHFEKQRSTDDEKCIAYCSKTTDPTFIDGPYIYGEPCSQGKRSDLLEIKKKIDANASEKIIADEHFGSWSRYYRAFRDYRLLSMDSTRTKPEVFVLYGGTGLGKTYLAKELLGADTYWQSAPSTRTSGLYWDGYHHESILMDEFYGWMRFDSLLRLCDENPFKMDIKGGHTWCKATRIGFTSNTHPGDWYKVSNWLAFVRRVTKWIYFYDYKKYFITANYDSFCERIATHQ